MGGPRLETLDEANLETDAFFQVNHVKCWGGVATFFLKGVGLPPFKRNGAFFKTSERVATWKKNKKNKKKCFQKSRSMERERLHH